MDIEKEINEIKTKLQEIEKAQKEKQNIRPRAEVAGFYWKIDRNGVVVRVVEDNDQFNKKDYDSGNYYLDKEEAEKIAKEVKERLEFWREYDEARTVPADGAGFVIFLSCVDSEPTIFYRMNIDGERKFKTEGHAEAFIEKFGKTQIIKQLKKGRP